MNNLLVEATVTTKQNFTPVSGYTKTNIASISFNETKFVGFNFVNPPSKDFVFNMLTLAPNKLSSDDKVWDDIERFFANKDDSASVDTYDWLEDLRGNANSRLEDIYEPSSGK